jgi:hypothetical protein
VLSKRSVFSTAIKQRQMIEMGAYDQHRRRRGPEARVCIVGIVSEGHR